jgi:hypothetical protein
MSKHTPGPLKIWPGNLSSVSVRGGPNAFAVCACRLKGPDGRTTGDTIREGKANATLIVAAPDMLAALKAAQPFIKDQQAFNATCAAIAKAEGAS